jgi:nucleotide-binding universal stress UspA family protein
MRTVRKILVPVDFSECSMPALEWAHELAQRCGANLELLHVWQAPPFLPPQIMVGVEPAASLPLDELIEQNAGRELSVLTEQAGASSIIIGESTIRQGDPARTIVDYAKAEGHDLIVLGTHGRSGLVHLLLGSVAEKVVRWARVPVLTVPCPELAPKDH